MLPSARGVDPSLRHRQSVCPADRRYGVAAFRQWFRSSLLGIPLRLTLCLILHSIHDADKTVSRRSLETRQGWSYARSCQRATNDGTGGRSDSVGVKADLEAPPTERRGPPDIGAVVYLAELLQTAPCGRCLLCCLFRDIAENPLSPYDATIYWDYRFQNANHVLAPPVLLYWLAAARAALGNTPLLWKLSLLPWHLMLVASIYVLLRRWATPLAMPLTWMTVVSPALLPSANLMLDVPALTLSLAVVALMLQAVDHRSWTLAGVAGLFAGLAMQTKYSAFVTPLVLLVCRWTQRRLRFAVLAAGVAVLLFAVWELFVAMQVGESHFLVAAQQRSEALSKRILNMLLPTLTYTAAVVARRFFLGLLAWQRCGRWLAGGIAMVAIGFMLLGVIPAALNGVWSDPQTGRSAAKLDGLVRWHDGSLVVNVSCRYRHAVVDASKIIGSCVITQSLINAGTRMANGKYPFVFVLVAGCGICRRDWPEPLFCSARVLGIVVVATFLVSFVAARQAQSRRLAWAAATAAMAMGLAVALIDLREMQATQELAEAAVQIAKRENPQGRTWFSGAWAFQYYAMAGGLTPLDPDRSELCAGDLLILTQQQLSGIDFGVSDAPLAKVAAVRVEDWLPWRTRCATTAVARQCSTTKVPAWVSRPTASWPHLRRPTTASCCLWILCGGPRFSKGLTMLQARLALIVVLGLALRGYHFLSNPPVWHDEAAQIYNILNKDFCEILGPLFYSEACPPLFLALEKGTVMIFGDSTYALRLPPFMASCISLVAVVLLARRFLPTPALLWLALLLGCSDRLLWHSCEAKPYATDVLVATAVLALGRGSEGASSRAAEKLRCQLAVSAFCSPPLVFLAFPACFLLGGLALTVLPAVCRSRSRLTWLTYAAFVGTLAGSFLLLYSTAIQAQRNDLMLSCWVEAFPNWNRPWLVPTQLVVKLTELGRYAAEPAGNVLCVLGAIGLIALWRAGRQRLIGLLVWPVALNAVAWLLGSYPLGALRVGVYAAPAVLLLIAAGIVPAFSWLNRHGRLASLGLVALLLVPAGQALWVFVKPWTRLDSCCADRLCPETPTPGRACGWHAMGASLLLPRAGVVIPLLASQPTTAVAAAGHGLVERCLDRAQRCGQLMAPVLARSNVAGRAGRAIEPWHSMANRGTNRFSRCDGAAVAAVKQRQDPVLGLTCSTQAAGAHTAICRRAGSRGFPAACRCAPPP